jgi:hypothetical protein
MSVPHRDPDASQSSIRQFLTPLAPKSAVPALIGDTVVAPITDGGVIVIDDDDGGNPMSSVRASPAVRGATIAVASGVAITAQLPVRRRRVNDDDAVAVPIPIPAAQAAPTARRRRIIEDDDDDDAIAASVPAAATPADASDADAAVPYEDEVALPHDVLYNM